MLKNTLLRIVSIPCKGSFLVTFSLLFLGVFQTAKSQQDVGVTAIMGLSSPMCAKGNQAVMVRIKNHASDTIKYATHNVIVTVKTTGASTQTFKDTLKTGSLANDSTQDITFHFNLNVAGTHIFKAYTMVTADANTLNDTLANDSIIVKPVPAAVITLSDSSSLCVGDTTILWSDSTSGNMWTGGSTADSLIVFATGKYVLIVTAGGCTTVSDTARITVSPYPATPVITAHDTTIFCIGHHVILTSSSTTGNKWTGGSMNDSLTVTTSGSYYVTVTTAGCTSDSSAVMPVLVNPLPIVALAAFTTTPCANSPAFLLTGGTPAAGVYSGIGVLGGYFFPNQAGHIQGITYTYTNANGCSNSASKNMTVDACAGIEENSNLLDVKVYPNPNSNGLITIALKNVNSTELMISIVDVLGNEVFKIVDKNIQTDYTKQINIENLATGIYFIKLNTGSDSGAKHIQKLIVE